MGATRFDLDQYGMTHHCPLCKTQSLPFYEDQKHLFHHCPKCFAIFRDPEQFLIQSEERKRYLHHKGAVDDKGYYEFVKPMIKEVKRHCQRGDAGLDFGCGHTPVLSEHLKNEGFAMSIFDPIFHHDIGVLQPGYQFIVCCEVIEHFYDPLKEFKKLYDLLLPGGKLICKTHIFDDSIQFGGWYYKNDPSHVIIYRDRTFEWIRESCRFGDVKIEERVITFSK